MSDENITRRTLSDRRTGRTDWQRLNRLSDTEIAAQATDDKDVAPIATSDWLEGAELVAPGKRAINIRLDTDILDYFQAAGGRYQTRINQVLRAYVEAHRKRA